MAKKNDLELFDDNDWLLKEKEREKRISAWDFDDGKKLRNEHLGNCEVERVAKSHHFHHLADNRFNIKTIKQIEGNNLIKDIIWFVLDIVLFIFLTILNSLLGDMAYFPAVVLLFLTINPGIFIWAFVLKRFPSESYSKTVFFLAIIIQIIGMIMKEIN